MTKPWFRFSIVAGCLLMLTLFACTVHVKIDDRLSYVATKKLKGRYTCQRNPHFVLNEMSKKLVVAQHPNGYVGGAGEYHFAIGEIFWAYLDQASQAAFQSSGSLKKVPVTIEVKISDYDLAFTNSLMGHGIDWTKLAMNLETRYSNQKPINIRVQREVELSSFDMVGVSSRNQAIEMALEGIVFDFLDKATSSIEVLDC